MHVLLAAAVTLAGMDLQVTQYGTTYRMLTVTTVDGIVEIGVTSRLTAVVQVPLSATVLSDEGCCIVHAGNLGAGARFGEIGERLSWSIAAGVSLPTSFSTFDYERLNSRYAATATLFHNAGRFLPETTTVRLDAAARWRFSPRLSAFAGAGVHDWIRSSGHTFVVPLVTTLRLDLGRGFDADAGLVTVVNPGEDETLIHAVELAASWRGERWTVSGRLDIPTDDSLRNIAMIGGGVLVTRSF